MTPLEAVSILKQALWTAVVLSTPMLLFGLVAGLVVSVFQAVTQIHEMTLTFIPKILAVILGLVLFLPWMLNMMITYTSNLWLGAARMR
ncbi:MAG: flagellar biosynthesis protein FliQ [Candidatus Eisenbacteria bacterium]|nr:flagellar biosynthesis protein FliQ [Candidatus Eisenbacteria bacterium]